LQARGCAANTVQAYRTDLSQFALFLHPRMAGHPAWGLRDVGPDHVRQFIQDLTERRRKPRTIARKVASVRSCFRFLRDEGVLDLNPIAYVNVEAVANQTETLRQDLLEEALSEGAEGADFRSVRDRAILEILYGSGLRLRELVSLNLSSLNMEQKTLRLQDGAHADDERILPLGSKAVASLSRYLTRRADQLVDRDISQIDAGALFVNDRGKRLHRRSVQRIVARALPADGEGTPSTPQLLRSSFATHLLERGASVSSVQAMLGQTSLPIGTREPSSLQHLRIIYDRAHPRAFREAGGGPTPDAGGVEAIE